MQRDLRNQCGRNQPKRIWTVVDLGSFHNEGELLVAADDRLAELLEWPSAQETTLLRWQSRQVGSAGDSSQLQVLIRRLAGVPPL
jgi:hypothetical protein